VHRERGCTTGGDESATLSGQCAATARAQSDLPVVADVTARTSRAAIAAAARESAETSGVNISSGSGTAMQEEGVRNHTLQDSVTRTAMD